MNSILKILADNIKFEKTCPINNKSNIYKMQPFSNNSGVSNKTNNNSLSCCPVLTTSNICIAFLIFLFCL